VGPYNIHNFLHENTVGKVTFLGCCYRREGFAR